MCRHNRHLLCHSVYGKSHPQFSMEWRLFCNFDEDYAEMRAAKTKSFDLCQFGFGSVDSCLFLGLYVAKRLSIVS